MDSFIHLWNKFISIFCTAIKHSSHPISAQEIALLLLNLCVAAVGNDFPRVPDYCTLFHASFIVFFFTLYVVFKLTEIQEHGCVVITQNFVSRYELMECIAKLSFLSSHLPTGLDHSFLVDLAFDSEAQYPKANSPDYTRCTFLKN